MQRGLRISEIVSLQISDIDSARMLIRVEQGKGRKDRYVVLSPHLLDLLRIWWKAAHPRAWLFPGPIACSVFRRSSATGPAMPRRGEPGSTKRVSMHTRFALVEAPIDALSLGALDSARKDTHYAASGGGVGPATIEVLERILATMASPPARSSAAPRTPIAPASATPCAIKSSRPALASPFLWQFQPRYLANQKQTRMKATRPVTQYVATESSRGEGLVGGKIARGAVREWQFRLGPGSPLMLLGGPRGR